MLKSKWLTIIIIAGIGWLSLSSIKIKLHDNLVNKEVADIEDKIQNLEEDNSALERFVEYMKNPMFLEKEARLKLNYRAEGESVAFIYPDNGDHPASQSADLSKELAQMSNIAKWAYYLIGY